MNIRHLLTTGLTMFSVFTMVATPAFSGIILIGGEGGTSDPPAPTQGAQTEEDWNPTVTCTVGAGEGILDLLACLHNEISGPPPPCLSSLTTPTGDTNDPVELTTTPYPEPCYPYPYDRSDFNVWVLTPPPDRWGVEIRKLDNTEIKRVSIRENDPGIQTTELQLDANWRVARVRLVAEQPTGTGNIFLTLNDTIVSVPTSALHSSAEVNQALLAQLARAPFTVAHVGDYLHIRTKRWMGTGIRRVQFRSTDPGIISSDLSLYQESDLTIIKEIVVETVE